jgi:hypothetical protein
MQQFRADQHSEKNSPPPRNDWLIQIATSTIDERGHAIGNSPIKTRQRFV